MTRRLRIVAGLAVLGALPLAGGGIAGAAPSPIGQNQHFVGLVNGKHIHAVIYVVCPGPAGGARTGPPAGKQTVAIRRVKAGGGDTGAGGHDVGARVTPTTIIMLGSYGHPVPIPTSARVPCQGRGTVAFSPCPLPQPCGSGAKVDNIQVTFLNIAAAR